MTAGKAIETLEYIRRTGNGEGEYKNDAQAIAIDMAIKALEQVSVLDKIEKEINSPNRGTCDYFIVDRIEDIINKYKAESKKGTEMEVDE